MSFREKRKSNRNVSWKTYVSHEFEKRISIIFEDEITAKDFKTRESSDTSFKKFLKTKKEI